MNFTFVITIGASGPLDCHFVYRTHVNFIPRDENPVRVFATEITKNHMRFKKIELQIDRKNIAKI